MYSNLITYVSPTAFNGANISAVLCVSFLLPKISIFNILHASFNFGHYSSTHIFLILCFITIPIRALRSNRLTSVNASSFLNLTVRNLLVCVYCMCMCVCVCVHDERESEREREREGERMCVQMCARICELFLFSLSFCVSFPAQKCQSPIYLQTFIFIPQRALGQQNHVCLTHGLRWYSFHQ